MSLVVARKKRTALYLSIAGLLAIVAAVSAISARDPDGAALRVGMVMMMVGAALLLPWQALLPAALVIWFGPNYARSALDDTTLFSTNMVLELVGLLGVALLAWLSRLNLRRLEDEDMLVGATSDEFGGVDAETGVYEERLLRPALDAELARARRFGHEFAFVLVGVDELRQKFDYRDQEVWKQGISATANLLRSTRTHIDRAYRFGNANFALILPESGEREVTGLIRRLRHVSRQATPAEGEPGGPLPTHFGATFFPQCATTTDDLLRRAEIALRLADKNSTRVQIDGAEAPDMPALETLRREDAAQLIGGDVAVSDDAPLITSPELATSLLEADEQSDAEELPTTSAMPAVAIEMPEVVIDLEPEPEPEPEPEQEADAPAPIPQRPYAEASPDWEDPLLSYEPVLDVVAEEDVGEPEIPLPEPIPFAAYAEGVPDLEVEEVVTEPEQSLEPAHEAPTPISAFAEKSAVTEDDSMDDIMKHLDETLAMLRSLRTGS